jgi:hypothetical protein
VESYSDDTALLVSVEGRTLMVIVTIFLGFRVFGCVGA